MAAAQAGVIDQLAGGALQEHLHTLGGGGHVEARTQAGNGALWLGDDRVQDADSAWDSANPVLLRFGKKKFQRVRVE
jgi:tyrosyl-tRNA synthetase